MSKFISDSSHEAKLNKIATSNAVHVCSGDPTTRAQVLTNTLANFAPSYTGPSSSPGDPRSVLTLTQVTGVLVTASGTAATLCHIDATELLAKSDVTGTPSLTSGQTIQVNASTINSNQAV